MSYARETARDRARRTPQRRPTRATARRGSQSARAVDSPLGARIDNRTLVRCSSCQLDPNRTTAGTDTCLHRRASARWEPDSPSLAWMWCGRPAQCQSVGRGPVCCPESAQRECARGATARGETTPRALQLHRYRRSLEQRQCRRVVVGRLPIRVSACNVRRPWPPAAQGGPNGPFALSAVIFDSARVASARAPSQRVCD